MNVNKAITKDYEKMDTWWDRKNEPKTNPIKAKTNPILHQNEANSNPNEANLPTPQTTRFAQFNTNELRTMNNQLIKKQTQLVLRSLRPSRIESNSNPNKPRPLDLLSSVKLTLELKTESRYHRNVTLTAHFMLECSQWRLIFEGEKYPEPLKVLPAIFGKAGH